MKLRFFALCLIALTACKEEVAQDTSAVPLNEDAVGHYCQMDLLEHDGPKAQAHLSGLPGAPLFFSQVRDVVAYLRMPEQSHEVLTVWVNDMGAPEAAWDAPGANNWIDANDAIYVVGASVVGGMGAPELVPFSKSQDAIEFAHLNGGDVMHLADIPDQAVLAPVVLDGGTDDAEFDSRQRALSRKLGE